MSFTDLNYNDIVSLLKNLTLNTIIMQKSR